MALKRKSGGGGLLLSDSGGALRGCCCTQPAPMHTATISILYGGSFTCSCEGGGCWSGQSTSVGGDCTGFSASATQRNGSSGTAYSGFVDERMELKSASGVAGNWYLLDYNRDTTAGATFHASLSASARCNGDLDKSNAPYLHVEVYNVNAKTEVRLTVNLDGSTHAITVPPGGSATRLYDVPAPTGGSSVSTTATVTGTILHLD